VEKKKIWANFQRIIVLFTQKIVTKLSKIWIWDPGSGKNLFRIPDPGVKKAPDPGSGSATLNFRHDGIIISTTANCFPIPCLTQFIVNKPFKPTSTIKKKTAPRSFLSPKRHFMLDFDLVY
jgi:hypothetical protein